MLSSVPSSVYSISCSTTKSWIFLNYNWLLNTLPYSFSLDFGLKSRSTWKNLQHTTIIIIIDLTGHNIIYIYIYKRNLLVHSNFPTGCYNHSISYWPTKRHLRVFAWHWLAAASSPFPYPLLPQILLSDGHALKIIGMFQLIESGKLYSSTNSPKHSRITESQLSKLFTISGIASFPVGPEISQK